MYAPQMDVAVGDMSGDLLSEPGGETMPGRRVPSIGVILHGEDRQVIETAAVRCGGGLQLGTQRTFAGGHRR